VSCLSGVNAPGDRLSPRYSEEISFTKKEAVDIFSEKGIKLSEKSEKLMEVKSYTDNSYPTEIEVGTKKLCGKDIREYFSLPSPFFEVTESSSEVVFTVYGRGHGVGMSQYSADYMARQGFTYKDILLHFYKGAEITQ